MNKCVETIKIIFLLLSLRNLFVRAQVDLEKLLSAEQVPTTCEFIIFNDGPQQFFNFLPFQRPTIIYRHNHDSAENYEKNYVGDSGFRQNLTSAECYVLVIFGFYSKELIYDDFVKRNFNRIHIILIFPLMKHFYTSKVNRYPWKNIWDHNTRIIDYSTSRILFTAKPNRFCALKDPICVLKGISKKVGYKSSSPYLHVQNWGNYSSTYYPPVHFHPRSPLSELKLVSGLEGELLKHLVLEYNMNLTLIVPLDMEFGIKLANDSWTGKFGLLERGEVDWVAGVISGNWERRDLGTYLAPLYNIKFALISRKSRPIMHWNAPFSVFSGMVWITIFGSFAVVLMFMAFVSIIRGYSTTSRERSGLLHNNNSSSSFVLQLTMAALRQPLVKTPCGPNSLTFTSWMLCLFIICSLYSSYLTARLSIRSPTRQINTMRDIWQMEHKLLVFAGGTVDAYMKMSQDPDSLYVLKHNHRFTNTIMNYTAVSAVDANDKLVATSGVESFQFNVLAELDGIKRNIKDYHFSKEPIVNTFCSWMASKNLRESPALKVAMLRAFDLGLMEKWFNKPLIIDGKKTIFMSKTSTKGENSQKIKKQLSMHELKGVFLTWMVGCGISLVVFFMELRICGFATKPKTKPQILIQKWQYYK